ncbi:MAG: DUF3365 domain-containing protein [Thiogranum sp.]|nr:DUF3365 domain-containing protein [Thiogranum sp.]
MHRFSVILMSVAAMSLMAGTGSAEDNLEARAATSRTVTQDFMKTLKGELQEAIKEGGPVHAIAVCQDVAPRIADDFSAKKGWEVGRTSLKTRNPDNAPDDWERDVLKTFDRQLAKGQDPKTMEHYEVVQQDGTQVFRYMKAIPTAEVCLTCHGKQVGGAVAGRLEELYPQDEATGYEVGEIRGAFTITQPM